MYIVIPHISHYNSVTHNGAVDSNLYTTIMSLGCLGVWDADTVSNTIYIEQ